MTMHIVLKFQYYAWNKDTNDIVTIDAHREVLDKHGACHWGRVNGIAQSKYEVIREQLDNNEPVYCFLYTTKVPRSVNKDGNLWYVAELKDLVLGTPKEKDLIPDYYRSSVNLETSFLLKNIQALDFDEGQTPKVPGQSSIRYVTLEGSPVPSNLKRYGKDSLLCENLSQSKGKSILTEVKEVISKPIEATSNYLEELLSAKDEIIELKQEIIDLIEYRELYKKILNTEYLFSSEKFLETWIEENIHKIMPELTIIDRQPHASWKDGKFARLDLLAINKENKDIAIIEVKTRKRRVKSGYDQYLRYTTWVKENKSKLIEKYKKHGLDISDNPEFIIITDYITDEMKAICKNHNIKLIKIFGGLGIEEVA
ncbi:MAG: hypothetical protein H6621_09950 [Halobacteriovoraceae bacterium]|nr:hypothetical protein [Halobacteriovoraceae bacterium]MCB9095380.1 hypothetical protein [Halobacteriovoraceae bacterium]